MAAPITMPTSTTPPTPRIDERTGKPLTAVQCVRDRIDEVLDRFANGETCRAIGESMEVPAMHHTVRQTMRSTPEWAARYDAALLVRGHGFLERTIDIAEKAEKLGDGAGFRVAADVYMKVAAKLNPGELGDKTQLAVSGSLTMRAEDLSDAQLAAIAAGGLAP